MDNQTVKIGEAAQTKFQKLLVQETITVKEALKHLDEGAEKILIVVNDANQLCGTITDGDIRRWILREGNLNAPVSGFYHRDPKFVFENHDISAVKEMMIREKIEVVPVINDERRVVNVLIWDEIFSTEKKKLRKALKAPVFIMAGGKGVRMDPLTRILPKPLIPLGEKPISELIMDRFFEFGCHEFYLIVITKGRWCSPILKASKLLIKSNSSGKRNYAEPPEGLALPKNW